MEKIMQDISKGDKVRILAEGPFMGMEAVVQRTNLKSSTRWTDKNCTKPVNPFEGHMVKTKGCNVLVRDEQLSLVG